MTTVTIQNNIDPAGENTVRIFSQSLPAGNIIQLEMCKANFVYNYPEYVVPLQNSVTGSLVVTQDALVGRLKLFIDDSLRYQSLFTMKQTKQN